MHTTLIYGGSFNPPHKGHAAIIEQCLRNPLFDAVWVMPSANRTDKPAMISAARRMAMVASMCHERWPNQSKLQVSDFEIKLGAPTETIRTYEALVAAYPNTQFYFIFGSDALADMRAWRGGTYLQEKLDLVVVERAGSAVRCDPAQHICAYVDETVSGISSTKVRQACSDGLAIEPFVTPKVAGYIKKHQLYC